MRKYEVVYCLHCRTELHITKNNRNQVVSCLCGKKIMVVTQNGKYKLAGFKSNS